METLAPSSISRYLTIRVTTRARTEFVDLTDHLNAVVGGLRIRVGLINVQSLHTTTAIVVNEHEPLLLCDFAALLEQAAPAHAVYRHDDASARTVNVLPDERINGHAHCRALLLPPSVVLNVVEGRIALGRWQRVFLVELDGARDREVSLVVFGETER